MTEAALFHKGIPPQAGKVVPSTIGSMNYHVLRAILEEGRFLQLRRGAEIGVLAATTSEYLLSRFPELNLFCVDPYTSYEKFEENRTGEAMNNFEQEARARLSKFGTRATFVKDFSVQAATRFEDNSLDFVFIDAIHTYEAVFADVTAWFPKVRKHGLIAGHDISWPGIKDAVEAFVGPRGLPAFYSPSTSDVWFFVKQG